MEANMNKLYQTILTYLGNEEGQGLVEYALILVLIAIVVILMLTGLGQNVNDTFSTVNSALE
jgi:pilus assembly protein Flp/PilA